MSARLLRSRVAPYLFVSALLAFVHWGAVNVGGTREAGFHTDQGLWNPILFAPKDDGVPRPVEMTRAVAIVPAPTDGNRRAGAGPLFGTLALVIVFTLTLDAISHFD